MIDEDKKDIYTYIPSTNSIIDEDKKQIRQI